MDLTHQSDPFTLVKVTSGIKAAHFPPQRHTPVP